MFSNTLYPKKNIGNNNNLMGQSIFHLHTLKNIVISLQLNPNETDLSIVLLYREPPVGDEVPLLVRLHVTYQHVVEVPGRKTTLA